MAEAPDVRLVAAEQGRFDVEGFCFVSQSLRHAAALTAGPRAPGERRHLTAQQLVDGVVDLAAERYGLLAEVVLRRWGIRCGDDIGVITFTLIEKGVFSKQPSDRPEDFYGGPSFDVALRERVSARLAKRR
jgi:uncharacterized repeat protein (TIGR04138 family)